MVKTTTKKIDPIWFNMILSGKKKFELRLADFDIAEGDVLRVEEWIGEGDERKSTGRSVEKVVTHLQIIDLQKWMRQ